MYSKFFKRVLDFVFSLLGVLGLLPVYLLLTIMGAIFMRGNPFFTQERVSGFTRSGKIKTFKILKFRSMKKPAENDGLSVSLSSRLNLYGRILRATSLDETLQLINVLLGQMSIVGPRPVPSDELNECNSRQLSRLTVKGGITGLAQVSGRNSLTRSQKYDFDAVYASNVRFKTDLKIILATFFVVVKREGIYGKACEKVETSLSRNRFSGVLNEPTYQNSNILD